MINFNENTMCPNCDRGLVRPSNEVCEMCAGTGFFNPNQSLTANDKPMDENEVVAPAVEEVPATPEVANEAPAEAAEEVAPEAAPEEAVA